jgi:hypothetical protein
MKIIKNKKYIIIIIFILLLIILITLLFYKYYLNRNKFYESFEDKKTIEIIISRYNENLEWLQNEPYNKYSYIVYNKGINSDYYKSNNFIKEIKLPNVGRESHSYLYHIINNYNDLKDINIFLLGSNNDPIKKKESDKLIKMIEDTNSAVFISSEYNDVKNDLYSFTLDHWEGTNEDNAKLLSKNNFEKAKIRPFGKWFENKFGDLNIKNIAWRGTFSVSKEDIIQKPQSFYESLITDLDNNSNPEEGHYFERSWAAIFHPMNNTIISSY